MSCANQISELVEYMEQGGHPMPYMFYGTNCTGARWPQNRQDVLTTYNQTFDRTALCQDATKAKCLVPIVESMIVQPNVKVVFRSNQTNHTDGKSDKIVAAIKEFGQLNLYHEDCQNSICSQSEFTWNSSVCPNAGEKACDSDNKSNCMFNIPDNEYYNGEQLLRSMVSCGSKFYPSFMGLQTDNPGIGTSWNECQLGRNDSGKGYLEHNSYCVQNNLATIEKASYAKVWEATPPFFNSEVCTVTGTAIQACSCISTKTNTENSATAHIIDNIGGGNCSSIACGECVETTTNPVDGGVISEIFHKCQCSQGMPGPQWIRPGLYRFAGGRQSTTHYLGQLASLVLSKRLVDCRLSDCTLRQWYSYVRRCYATNLC